jgi:predicted AAA+ superfamily ATPase
MNQFERNVVHYLTELLGNFPAVAIIGARQVGKTTLAKMVATDFTYLDLERGSDYDQLAADPEFFFKKYPDKVIFDEAQRLPVLFNTLRGVIDEQRDKNGRFILTGSSNPSLLKNVSESLAGRIAIIELGTLKMNEMLHKPLSQFYELFQQPLSKSNVNLDLDKRSLEQVQACWLKGGYPQPGAKNNHFRHQWMTHYEMTYLNRDIAELFPRLDQIAYRRFISMLGRLSGKIINKSDLARSIGVSEPTIRQYLTIANGTFLWRELPSFDYNVTKSIMKMPKGYIRDSGLLHHLLHIESLEILYGDPIAGFSFEAFVVEEILKGIADKGIPNVKAYYYRTRDGAEIDLILHGNFGILPIEVKLGSTIIRRQLKTLDSFVLEHNLPFGIIINQNEQLEWITERILQVPAGCL